MLPGFRFLFSAIVFCISILVFGLGAAALLRAAHEQFASRPSWYPTPSTTLAQQGEPFGQQGESTAAVLSLLEVDPDDNDMSRQAPHDSPPEPGFQAAAIETTAAVTDPAAGKLPDGPKLAAPGVPEQPSPPTTSEAASDVLPTPEPDKLANVEPETPLGEGSSTVEPAALITTNEPAALIATNEPETGIAPVDESVPKAVEPSTATSEPINVPAVRPEPAAPQIAALGRSGEATDTQARDKDANNDTRAQASRIVVRNRLRAQRAAKARRRLAHRARIVRRAAVQQQQPPAAFTALPATTNLTATENPYRF